MAQKLRANERNNSQYCSPDSVGSCCDRVGEWCANNFRQRWDLQCIVGRIQPLIKTLETMSNARSWPQQCWKRRAVQTDPTLLRYASAITEQKKCWELLAQDFKLFQTLPNNMQQQATGCANGRSM